MNIISNISYQQNNRKSPNFQGYLVKNGQELLPAFLNLFEKSGRKEFYSLNKIPIGDFMSREQVAEIAKKMATRDEGGPVVDVFLKQEELSELMEIVNKKGFAAAKAEFDGSFKNGKGAQAHEALVKFKEENGLPVFEKILEFIQKADEFSSEQYQKIVQGLNGIKNQLIQK